MGDEQEIAQGFNGHLGEADENPWIVQVVIGDEISFRIAGHEFFAAVEGHLENNLVAVIVQAEKQPAFHFYRWSAVRRAFFRAGKGERELANGVVGDRLFTLQDYSTLGKNQCDYSLSSGEDRLAG